MTWNVCMTSSSQDSSSAFYSAKMPFFFIYSHFMCHAAIFKTFIYFPQYFSWLSLVILITWGRTNQVTNPLRADGMSTVHVQGEHPQYYGFNYKSSSLPSSLTIIKTQKQAVQAELKVKPADTTAAFYSRLSPHRTKTNMETKTDGQGKRKHYTQRAREGGREGADVFLLALKNHQQL